MIVTAIDLSHGLEGILNSLMTQGAALGWTLIKAFLVFIVGRLLINLVNKLIKRVLLKRDIDPSVKTFVGRLNVDKGIFELLDAFAKLQNKYSRIALLLIGNFDGDLPIRLHGIRNNPDIIITGWIEDVPKYISAADVMVLPSYREGFSMVIQQAMAMAIPVITTDIPGPSEVIENGISGLLVQPKSTESLFDAMNWTISHSKQCQMMGASGRLRCETLFSRDRMLGLTLLDREDILKSGPVDKK